MTIEEMKKLPNYFTSEKILKDMEYNECPEFVECLSMHGVIYYELSDAEIDYVGFITGKYSIADYLYYNSVDCDDDEFIVCIEPYDLSRALDEDCDGHGKAVCLSDDTALQAICFYAYIEK